MTDEAFDASAAAGDGHPASLYLCSDRVVWTSAGYFGGQTRRPAISLLVGAYRELAITTGSGTHHRGRALLVAANVSRSLDARGSGFYSLSLDPAHPRCRQLRERILSGCDVIDLSGALNAGTASALASAITHPGKIEDAMKLSEHLLSHFFPHGDLPLVPIDPRVQRTADWLVRHVPARPDLDRLAQDCHLSQGRLRHLFTQELGVSLRTYLLWAKMRRAAELFASDLSLTEVAATIGFADSAHLARVFRTYFSAAPSFLANRRLVHVHVARVGA